MLARFSGIRRVAWLGAVFATLSVVGVALSACGGKSEAVGDVVVKVNLESQTVAAGSTEVRVTIDMTGYGSVAPAAYEFRLNFDPKIISVDKSDPGAFLTSSGRKPLCSQSRVDNPRGVVHVVCASSGTQTSKPNGPLATLTLHAVALGTTPLVLSDVIVTDQLGAELASNHVDSELTVE